MTKTPSTIFSPRKGIIIDLPLPANTDLLHPEHTIVRVGKVLNDIGAFCYTLRAQKKRSPGAACEVVLDSLLEERVPKVASLLRILSTLLTDGGLREQTIDGYCGSLKQFMDWADRHGIHDCLSGGDATRNAYRKYANHVEDRYRRHEIGSAAGFQKQGQIRTLLEGLTGLEDLGRGIRLIRVDAREHHVTEPASQHDFSHVLALNEALFRGLCNLVLNGKPFPYQLTLPEGLGWQESHLWLFPASQWFQHPKAHGARAIQYNVYDYSKGCLAAEDDIWQHYNGRTEGAKRLLSRRAINKSQTTLDQANSELGGYSRRRLASIAQSAFFFLFLANTGGNLQTVIDIETDGTLDEGTVNQGYRSTKWRAGGKEVDLVVPVAFMPSLRRYLELRAYLLDGADHPHLFLNRGKSYTASPSKFVPSALVNIYYLLRRIDPTLPQIRPKKVRATVSDYYHRQHDAAITAAVLQNTEATALKNYNAGSETDHQVEMSLLLQKIAAKAQTQIIRPMEVLKKHRPLEDGGVCPSYGQPESLTADAPVIPNCKTGCLFCAKRILIANEEDMRKVASAAFLMERLIMGPLSEAEYRPQIDKCDEDLDNLRAFEGCAEMVDRIKADVYENGSLTPYFSDKYQLFLTLGML